jgi:acetyl esterase/lipase
VYRVEAWLEVAGELRPWIYSNPVYVGGDSLAALKNLRVPPSETPPGVAVRRAQRHTHGAEADAAKQSLDVYWPTNRTGLPVLFFIHGGAWRFGDRAQYFAIGNHFARHGFVTVLPGYRLAPAHKHPAQIEDVAAAFAWTVRHAAEFGGDTNRSVIAGHSAGGHLAALLALDTRRLAAHGLSPAALRGVAGLSGVYDIVMAEGQPKVFTTDVAVQRDASPMTHVKPGAPPFLLTYCEFDYYSLPTQARLFQTALNKAGVPAQLHYTPDENHISEVMAYLDDRNATAKELLRFLREAVK